MNIVDIAVKRPVAVWMFTFAIVLFGMVSLSRLPINLLPELSYPTLTIRTDYVGAAPGEIEQLVSKPIEETIGVVKGVRKVTSSSTSGQSDVLLEFEWGTDMDMASLEVREKLDTLILPLDVEKPVLLRFNPSLDPVMRLGFGIGSTSNTGKNVDVTQSAALDVTSMKRLREYAEQQIKRKLESISGVASIKIGGGLESEIHVLVDQQKASQLAIPMSDIIKRLKEENVNAAGGRVDDGSQAYTVRTLNQFTSIQDMQNVFVARRDNKNIRLGDIAVIQDAYKERNSITRFDGLEGVEIAIYKEGDANTVQVAQNVNAELRQLESALPANYKIQLIYDQSVFIANAIDDVKSAGIIGGVLAMVVLYLFLRNVWPTLIISLSIPVSIIATFNLMYGNNISLNIMSLGGIALAIGLLVDNAIVVLENIERHKQTQSDVKQAAAQGTKQVSMAIIASTLTTMAVFFPLVFVKGIAGQLFADQALTVTFALGASLLVALTVIPMLAAQARSKPAHGDTSLGVTDSANTHQQPPRPLTNPFYDTIDLSGAGFDSDFDPSLNNSSGGQAGVKSGGEPSVTKRIFATLALPFVWLSRGVFHYLPLILSTAVLIVFRALAKLLGFIFKPLLWLFEKALNSVSFYYARLLKLALRAPALLLVGIVAIAASSLMFIPRLGMELIPSMSQGEFYVEVTLPSGTLLSYTDNTLSALSAFTEAQDGVKRTYSLAGTGSLMNASARQGGENWGKLNVVMQSDATSEQLKSLQQKMRDYLRRQAGVQAEFGQPELFSFAAPLSIDLVGYNLTSLAKYSAILVDALQQDSRFSDVTSSLQRGTPELKITFDHAKLAQLGLSAPQVSTLINAKVGGEVASQFNLDDRKIDILVRSLNTQRDSIEDIGRIIVNPGAQRAIALNAVADLSMSIGPSEITRIGQERVAVISANLAYGDLAQAVEMANQHIKDMNLPYSLQARVAGQSEEMKTSFASLKFALALAVFLVYLVMASQFESLLHPLLILLTVPLACAGSIFGLFITQTNISVVVFIGLIMLAGIVVNNAIVLIDRINQLRTEGVIKTQAIIEAAHNRLRPILMTTLTTSLGLLPMALGLGEGAEMRIPMAVTVIFGLLFATLLTLFFIPCLYALFDRKSDALMAQNAQPTSMTNKALGYE
ncbi:acriflavin resistance protein [Paraglaciecola sp. T6c]|uniref:efflux RND transporter permease subunit n=1 Tax=Pseudoalteromonas atlantica (strain T6c / ATCC BAA-1087) TaxID=3042615 RepID=UPI00005C6ACE|nr:efflux RND transporter permease subunit [Paraglaciecola sp. T6c]ABG40748.1 acriflavin resistance protein [Paraglaciecola sp. T6c]